MKFLVDECVDAAVTAWLRKQGYDVTAIVEGSAEGEVAVGAKALWGNARAGDEVEGTEIG